MPTPVPQSRRLPSLSTRLCDAHPLLHLAVQVTSAGILQLPEQRSAKQQEDARRRGALEARAADDPPTHAHLCSAHPPQHTHTHTHTHTHARLPHSHTHKHTASEPLPLPRRRAG